MVEPCIQLRRVSKRYSIRAHSEGLKNTLINLISGRSVPVQHHWALSHVDFEASPGDRVALMGPNGSGKSTLMRLIAGVLCPTEGQLEVSGRVAMLMQMGLGFHEELTGLENISLNASMFGCTESEIRAITPSILDFSELGSFAQVAIKHYSTGMRARLAFAISTAVEGDVFLLDEGLQAGDEAFRLKCSQKIDDLMRRGKTWLIASHDWREVLRLCNRGYLLDQGVVVASGPIEGVVEAYGKLMESLSVPRPYRLRAERIG